MFNEFRIIYQWGQKWIINGFLMADHDFAQVRQNTEMAKSVF